MKYSPVIHHRKSIRLKDYDYSKEGLYFITICCQNKEHLFGEILNGKMILNNAGLMIQRIYEELPKCFEKMEIGDYVIMPNHFHCVIEIVDFELNVGVPLVGNQMSGNNRATTRVAPTVGDIIGTFKSLTTIEYIKMVKQGKLPNFDKRIWQKNYYKVNCKAREGTLGCEHIVRNEKEYNKISEYIENNPSKWDEDKYR